MMILAVIFIYLIMVVQFQSLVSPFIIMFSIPLAFTGGFIALLLTGQEVNVLAMLGFIMLAGLIVNNGIVLIDYINQARKAGVSKHEAIISSGKTRVRPILMTVLTTVLAMLTMALGNHTDWRTGLWYRSDADCHSMYLRYVPSGKEHGRRGIIVNFTEIFLTKKRAASKIKLCIKK